MSLSYRIDLSHEIIVVEYSGLVTSDDFLTTYSMILDDENYRPGQCELSILLADTVLDVDFAAYQQIAKLTRDVYQETGLVGRVAVLSLNPPNIAHSKLYAALTEVEASNEALQIFENLDEALDYLGKSELYRELESLVN